MITVQYYNTSSTPAPHSPTPLQIHKHHISASTRLLVYSSFCMFNLVTKFYNLSGIYVAVKPCSYGYLPRSTKSVRFSELSASREITLQEIKSIYFEVFI